jgi:predicted ribosomally synthesized peptide with SipW-like signal peptide
MVTYCHGIEMSEIEGTEMQNSRPFRRHKKLGILALASFAVMTLATGTMMSMALFTDTRPDDNTFTTGTIVLDSTKIGALNLTTSALMPGDAIRSPVTVENDGTAQMRYAVSQTSTNADTKALRDSLLLVVRTEDTGGGAFGTDGDYCDDANGTSLHASAALGASSNLVGDPAQGSQTGDRTLNAGASEVLCFYVSLSISAPNTSQGASTTTTFTFAAEQTANN